MSKVAESYLARIKPYNPKRGYKVKRYTVFGIRFDVKRGWFRVDPDVAKYLRTIHQDNNNPDSPLVFDVCTDTQARRLIERERKAKLKRGIPADPIDTAADMTEDARAEAADAANHRAQSEQVGLLDDDDPEGRGDLTSDQVRRNVESSVGNSNAFNHADDLPPSGDELPDNLTVIDGIGEATEQKLYQAGYRTYEAIAGAPLLALSEVVGSRAKEVQKAAKKLAE